MLEIYDENLNNKLYTELRKTVKEEGIMVITKFEEMAMERGKIERNIEIAKKAISKGYNIEEVKDLTGLSIEEIEKLSK